LINFEEGKEIIDDMFEIALKESRKESRKSVIRESISKERTFSLHMDDNVLN